MMFLMWNALLDESRKFAAKIVFFSHNLHFFTLYTQDAVHIFNYFIL